MLVAQLVSVVLLWVLARRLGLPRWAAVVAAAAFALSPLVVALHRTVSLENLAVPWLLGAFALVLAPRRRTATCVAAGACLGVAVVTQAASLVLVPLAAWLLWRTGRSRTQRRAATARAGGSFAVVIGLAVAWTAARGELGSITVIGGGVLSAGVAWTDLDPIGPAVALAASVITIAAVPRLRPVAAGALALLALVVLGPGDQSVPFAILLIPFGALCIGGAAEWLWHADPTAPRGRRRHRPAGRLHVRGRPVRATAAVVGSAAAPRVVVGGRRRPPAARGDGTVVDRRTRAAAPGRPRRADAAGHAVDHRQRSDRATPDRRRRDVGGPRRARLRR